MKKKMILLVVVIVVILFGVFAFVHKPTYYRLYPFDRITGTYSIEVNGEPVTTIGEYHQYEGGEKTELKNDTKTFQIHDGGYGMHAIGFILDHDDLYAMTKDQYFLEREDIELEFTYYNTNWWHVTNMDIKFDIVEENDEWYALCNVDYTEPTEEGELVAKNVSRKTRLDDLEDTRIGFGI